MNKFLRKLTIAGLTLLITACTAITAATVDQPDVLHMEGPEMKSIQFNSGLPREGDKLSDSIQHPRISRRLLRENLELIERLPKEKFKVVGFTDNIECLAAGCLELSLRRTDAVLQWLVRHGVPSSQLMHDARGPYLGFNYPYTEGDRRISRRVDIQIVVADADVARPIGNEVATQSGKLPPLLSAPQMAAIQFKSGLPLAGKSLESALEDLEFYLTSLQRDVEVIRRYPQIKFEIVGFTDAAECHAARCQSVAANRAQLVYDWLLANGVPAASLKGPVSRGSAMPLDRGDTEQGRARNRRVEINLSPD
ncbi:OmpA family protein [Lysobacter enzymogenes]|uniref:OmpA family protein n=1 Tax=Lysobacter enzymogenes TaxID=69 RepID=UPI003850309E